ncbi:hypothetical protein DFAR_30003 [Desulfarculales bacterium]
MSGQPLEQVLRLLKSCAGARNKSTPIRPCPLSAYR